MRVVRGLACAVLLIISACVGGTTSAGIFTPWEQPAGANPAFARQVVAYPTHELPGTIIVDPASHFLYFIHDAGQAIRYGVGVGGKALSGPGVQQSIASRNGPIGIRLRKCWRASRSFASTWCSCKAASA